MNPNHHPLTTGQPPSWAWGWGQDRYGIFTEIKVGEVVQHMRWIPPGSFWMGSPEVEIGREPEEGPRHHVTLTQGFWLGDTPCTQALWEEIMGENPSHFKAPRQPVERITCDDTGRFFAALAQLRRGAEFALPTEAQWEYACRAGAEAANGPGGTQPERLDQVAWYKDSPTDKGGTQEVRRKRPNPWGLYDMLGNVWEWTSDAWDRNAYTKDPRTDPRQEQGSYRVVRGGSWDSDACFVRAASRFGYDPGYYSAYLGFRLLCAA